MTHKLNCRAYGNYQPPYEDCTCGADYVSLGGQRVLREFAGSAGKFDTNRDPGDETDKKPPKPVKKGGKKSAS